GSNVVRNDLSSMPVCKIIKPEIATTMQRHALLRTLQYIGDFNGKKLSSDFYKLDPSIDWRALITIRDGIAHQDERDNKHKIQLLLKDEARLKGIIDEVLKIHQRIAHLIIKQEKKIGYYYGDAEEYCERVIRLEQQKNDLNKANDHHSAPPPLKPRITPEEQQQFIQALINANQDEHNPQRLKKEDLNKLLDECTLLFTSGKELSKAVFGAVLKPISYLRKMGEEKKRDYDSLKSILEVANTPPKIGSKAIQLQQQNEAAQREKEREALFDGLVLIRDLSKQLELNPEEQFLLNPLKRVEAALEATDNMFLFLADCGYFHSGRTDLKTVEQWDAFNTQVGRPTLINLLKGNGVLNDAMEYNFGQLLQHLDRIKAYKIIPRCKLMSSNYEQLRTLRNYVEHGSPFYDFARFVTSGNKAVVTRYHIICKGLNYVVELHEYLSNLKDALTFEQSKEKKASASSSASSAPLSRWPSIFNTLSGGAYNYFNLFKNVLAYDQSKEKKESSSSSVATSSQSGRWPGIFNSVSEGARECYPLPEIESDDDEKVTKPLPREDDRAASSHRHE
ncbi:MAG: hypothetical protein PSV35_08835, partial [bacterium]|nr:hypothetical protein [bacterium]